MADRSELRSILRSAGLRWVARKILRVARPGLEMVPTLVGQEDLQVGQSRLGGVPDLPTGVDWPTNAAGPLAFVAQINLAEVAPFAEAADLPRAGQLLFFYDAAQGMHEVPVPDADCFRVLHHAGDDLTRATFPETLNERDRFHSCAVTFEPSLTLPSADSAPIERLGLSDDQIDRYDDATDELLPEDEEGGRCRLLGCPDQLQCDIGEECVDGWAEHEGVESPEDESAMVKEASRWRLLLQIDSVSEAKMQWGDVGYLYFMIREVDLAAGRFENVWTIMQCC
jgi:uncharacterized protein YwqG